MATDIFLSNLREAVVARVPSALQTGLYWSKGLHGNVAPYQITPSPDQGELLTFRTMQKGKFIWPFLSTLRKLFEDCCKVVFV